eukprot:m.130458 g.130458  ORF g.130458 m.130458 type:complete len:321 (+) comp9785_c0_seq3:1618-2580(+)
MHGAWPIAAGPAPHRRFCRGADSLAGAAARHLHDQQKRLLETGSCFGERAKQYAGDIVLRVWLALMHEVLVDGHAAKEVTVLGENGPNLGLHLGLELLKARLKWVKFLQPGLVLGCTGHFLLGARIPASIVTSGSRAGGSGWRSSCRGSSRFRRGRLLALCATGCLGLGGLGGGGGIGRVRGVCFCLCRATRACLAAAALCWGSCRATCICSCICSFTARCTGSRAVLHQVRPASVVVVLSWGCSGVLWGGLGGQVGAHWAGCSWRRSIGRILSRTVLVGGCGRCAAHVHPDWCLRRPPRVSAGAALFVPAAHSTALRLW